MNVPSLSTTLPTFVVCTIFLTTLCSCSTSHPSRVGDSTDYLPEAETTHYRETARIRRDQGTIRTNSANSRQPVKAANPDTITSASSNTHGKQPRKTEAEIGETSDIKIDDETRQRMTGGAETKTSENTKKQKKTKVESEVRDTSDLQIDEETKQKMNQVK